MLEKQPTYLSKCVNYRCNKRSKKIKEKKGKKGKDVDLYNASHAPGTSNAHLRTETEPPDRYLGHRPACKHSLGSDPITGTGSVSQQ